ncbi:hypothetical protein O9G_006096, partial [Rozella allomycis CSF55]
LNENDKTAEEVPKPIDNEVNASTEKDLLLKIIEDLRNENKAYQAMTQELTKKVEMLTEQIRILASKDNVAPPVNATPAVEVSPADVAPRNATEANPAVNEPAEKPKSFAVALPKNAKPKKTISKKLKLGKLARLFLKENEIQEYVATTSFVGNSVLEVYVVNHHALSFEEKCKEKELECKDRPDLLEIPSYAKVLNIETQVFQRLAFLYRQALTC